MIFMNFPSGYTDRRRRRQQQENAKKEYPKVIDGCDRFERHIEFRRWNRGKQWQIEWKRRWYPRQTETPHYNRQKDHRQRRRRLSKSVSWDLWPSRTFSGRPEIYAEKKKRTNSISFLHFFSIAAVRNADVASELKRTRVAVMRTVKGVRERKVAKISARWYVVRIWKTRRKRLLSGKAKERGVSKNGKDWWGYFIQTIINIIVCE